MRIIKFEGEHLEQLKDQEGQEYVREFITPDHVKVLEKDKYAFTILVKEKIVCCAGVIEYWPGRGVGWAFLQRDCRNAFYYIHKAAKRFLDNCPIKRIEATVDHGFKKGHRWVRALGFELEAPHLKAYMPDGGDSSLYARVR